MTARAQDAAGLGKSGKSLIRNSNAAAGVAVGVVLLRVRVPGVRGGLAALRGARGEEHPAQARRQAQGQRGKDPASCDVINNNFELSQLYNNGELEFLHALFICNNVLQ